MLVIKNMSIRRSSASSFDVNDSNPRMSQLRSRNNGTLFRSSGATTTNTLSQEPVVIPDSSCPSRDLPSLEPHIDYNHIGKLVYVASEAMGNPFGEKTIPQWISSFTRDECAMLSTIDSYVSNVPLPDTIRSDDPYHVSNVARYANIVDWIDHVSNVSAHLRSGSGYCFVNLGRTMVARVMLAITRCPVVKGLPFFQSELIWYLDQHGWLYSNFDMETIATKDPVSFCHIIPKNDSFCFYNTTDVIQNLGHTTELDFHFMFSLIGVESVESGPDEKDILIRSMRLDSKGTRRTLTKISSLMLAISFVAISFVVEGTVYSYDFHSTLFIALLATCYCTGNIGWFVLGLLFSPELAEAATLVSPSTPVRDTMWLAVFACIAGLISHFFPSIKQAAQAYSRFVDVDVEANIHEDACSTEPVGYSGRPLKKRDEKYHFQSGEIVSDHLQNSGYRNILSFLIQFCIGYALPSVISRILDFFSFVFNLTILSFTYNPDTFSDALDAVTMRDPVFRCFVAAWWRCMSIPIRAWRQVTIRLFPLLGVPIRMIPYTRAEIAALMTNETQARLRVSRDAFASAPLVTFDKTLEFLASPVNDVIGFFFRWFTSASGAQGVWQTSVVVHDFLSVASRVKKNLCGSRLATFYDFLSQMCGLKLQDGENQETGVSNWLNNHARKLGTWCTLKRQTRRLLSSFLVVLPLTPALFSEVSMDSVRTFAESSMSTIVGADSLSELMSRLLDLTATVVKSLGYGPLAKNLLAIGHPNNEEIKYDNFLENVERLLSGAKLDMSAIYYEHKKLTEFYKSRLLILDENDKGRCMAKLNRLRQIKSKLEMYEKSVTERQRATATLLQGDVQFGKTTMFKFLAALQAKWGDMGEPRRGQIIEGQKFDACRPWHNILEADDIGSRNVQGAEDTPLDMARRFINVFNTPIRSAIAEEKDCTFTKHMALNATCNKFDLIRDELTPEAGLARFDLVYTLRPDPKRSVKAGTATIPIESERQVKHIPTHLLFQQVKLSHFNGTVSATNVGPEMSFEEWLPSYKKQWLEFFHRYKSNYENSASTSNEICPHDNYRLNCSLCKVRSMQSQQLSADASQIPEVETVSDEGDSEMHKQGLFELTCGYYYGGLPGAATVFIVEKLGLQCFLMVSQEEWFHLHFALTSMAILAYGAGWVLLLIPYCFFWTNIAIMQNLVHRYSMFRSLGHAEYQQLINNAQRYGKYAVAGLSVGFLIGQIRKYRNQSRMHLQGVALGSETDADSVASTVLDSDSDESADAFEDSPPFALPSKRSEIQRVVKERNGSSEIEKAPWVKAEIIPTLGGPSSSGAKYETVVRDFRKLQWNILNNKGVKVGIVTQVRNGAVLMNHHVMKLVKTRGYVHASRKYVPETPDDVPGDLPNHWFRRKLTFDWNCVYVDEQQDCAVVRVVGGLPDVGDYTGYFCEISGSETSALYCVGNDFYSKAFASGPVESIWIDDQMVPQARKVSTSARNYDGLCGALYIDKASRSVVGMHVAGDGENQGIMTCVTANLLRKAWSRMKLLEPIKISITNEFYSSSARKGEESDKGIHRYMTGPSCMPIVEGFLSRKGGNTTEMVECPYKKDLEELVPGFSETKDYSGPLMNHPNVLNRPVAIVSSSQFDDVPKEIADSVTKEMIEEMMESPKPRDDTPCRPLTLREALNGIEGSNEFRPWKSSSAAGYPNGGKKCSLTTISNGERRLKPKPQLDFDKALAKVRNGYTSGTLSVACPKDEALPITKYDENFGGIPARVFFIDSWQFYLLCTMFLGPMAVDMMDHPDVFEHSIGIDPMSPDWHFNEQRFDKTRHKEQVAGDFMKYDWGHEDSPRVMTMEYTFAYCKHRLKYHDEDATIAAALAWECSRRAVNFDGVILSAQGLWQSGVKLTAIFGSLKNRFLFRCVFKYLNPTKKWRESVVLTVLGDDNRSALRCEADDDVVWNLPEIIRVMALFGMSMTGASKDDYTGFYSRWETEFLKRVSVWCPDLERYVGKLDINSLTRAFKCWKRPVDDEAQFLELVPGIKRELIPYGREIFQNWDNAIREIVNKYSMPVTKGVLMTYDDIVAGLKGKSKSHRTYHLQNGDSEGGGTLEVPSGTETQTENVSTRDAGEVVEEYQFSDGTILTASQERHKMPPMVEREAFIGTYAIPLNTYWSQEIFPLRDLIDTEFIKRRIEHFHGAAFQLRIRIAITASRFHAGMILASVLHHPSILDVRNEPTRGFVERNVYAKSRQHLQMEVAEDGAGILIIPFFDARGKMILSSAEASDYVRLSFTTLCPATHKDANAVNPTLNIYANFMGLEVIGNVAQTFQVNSTPDEERGKPSVLLDRVASAADVLSRIPPLAVPSQFVSRASGNAAGVLRALGYSRPIHTAGEPWVPQATPGFASANVHHNGHVVSFDHQQGVTMDTRMGGIESDNMSYEFFSKKPAPIFYGRLNPGEPVNTTLFRIPVTPMIGLELGNNETLPIPCAIPAMLNGFWHVRMCYKFVFAPPPTASQRLRIVYDSGDGVGYSHTINDNITFDLRAKKEITVKVDYFQPDNFMCRGEFVDPSSSPTHDPRCHNGVLIMSAESPLTGVEQPNGVHYVVEAWVEECLYGNPSYGYLSQFSLLDWKSNGDKAPNDSHVLAYNNPFGGDVGPSPTPQPPTPVPPTPTFTQPPAFSTSAPTPALGGEVESDAPTPRPSLLETFFPTRRPTLSPTSTPSGAPITQLPTSAPTSAPSTLPPATAAPTEQFQIVPIPVELWGGNDEMALETPTSFSSGDNTVAVTPVMFNPTANSVMTTEQEQTTTGANPITGTQWTVPPTSNNAYYSFVFTAPSVVNSYQGVVPTILEPYVFTFPEIQSMIGGTGGVVTTFGNYNVVDPQTNGLVVPHDAGGYKNYVGILARGRFTVNGIGYGRLPSEPDFLEDRIHSWVFPRGVTNTSFTIQSTFANCRIVGIGVYRVKPTQIRKMRKQANDTSDLPDASSVMHVRSHDSPPSDLMRVHVGEWNQSVRTHVKVPMTRTLLPTNVISQRTLYSTPNTIEFTPMKYVLSMYGGYRGGMVSTLVFSQDNVRAFAFRGSRPEDTNGTDFRFRGNEVYTTTVNQVCTAHFPYISRFRFIYGRESSHNVEDNYIAWATDAAGGASTVLEYENVGEDFTALYFLGPTVLTRN